MLEICFQICCNSELELVNIWDVTIELQNDGDILRVGADHKPHSILDKKTKTERGETTISYTATMANYFSMGECARIGFSFEKHRTNTRAGNHATYAAQWLKRFCCGCCTKAKPL